MMKKLLILGSIVLSFYCGVRAQTLDNMKYRSAAADGYDRSEVKFFVRIEAPSEVCQYDTTRFVAMVKGPEEYFYQWWKEGQEHKILSDSNVLLLPRTTAGAKGKYYCRVTDIARNTSVTSVTELVVHQRPEAVIVNPQGSDTLLCLNDEIILQGRSAVPGATVKWTNNRGEEAYQSNIKIKAIQDVEYVFTADNNGCLSSDTVNIRLNRPCVDIPSVINTVEGSAVTITAKTCDGQDIAASELVWYKGPTNLGSHNPLNLQNAKSDMTIVVKYTSGSCVATDTLTFRTKGVAAFVGGDDDGYTANCVPPVILEQKGVIHESCASLGDTAELRVIAEGTAIEYEWQKFNTYRFCFETVTALAGMTITGIHSDVLHFSSLTDAASGIYRCVLRACGEEVISDTFSLSVSGAPVIVSGLNPEQEYCLTQGYVDFNVVAQAGGKTGDLEYSWYKGNHLLQSGDDRFYHLPLNSAADSGVYRVVVKNLCGETADTAHLVVLSPPVIRACNDTLSVCRGGEATLWVNMEETAGYVYTLNRVEVMSVSPLVCVVKETIYSGPANQAVVRNVTVPGTYRWRVEHASCGYTESPVIYVRVEDPVTVIKEPSDTTVCEGTMLTLACQGGKTGMTPLKYEWYKDGLSIGTSSSGILTFNPVKKEDGGVYYCAVGNACAPVKSRPAEVTVKDKPRWIKITGSAEPEYCEGEVVTGLEVTLSAAEEIDSMRWFRGYTPLLEERMEGANTNKLVINGVKLEDRNQLFYLRMYNRCGYTDSYEAGDDISSFDVRRGARFVKGLEGEVDLTLCYGENSSLCVQAEGTAPLYYSWLVNGDSVTSGTKNCLAVESEKLDTLQRYTCHVYNPCGSEYTETNVLVFRQKLFPLSGGGHYCEGTAGREIVLEGTDSSCIYRLKEVISGRIIEEVDGADVVPLFGAVTFRNVPAGRYVVIGRSEQGCEEAMPDTVEVVEDPLPENYNLLVDRHPCGAELTGDLKLVHSEAQTVYHLLYLNAGMWLDLNLAYTGGRGEVKMPGQGLGWYKIKATHLLSGCERIWEDSVELKQRPYPEAVCPWEYVNQDSVYCSGTTSEVALQYPDSCYRSSYKYELRKEGVDSGVVRRGLPLIWSGLAAGSYSLQITNEWGCAVVNGAKDVYEKPLPRVYALEGDTLYCGGETGVKRIRLTGSEEGIKYRFAYLPAGVYKDTIGRGGILEVEVPLSDRDYYVQAIDTVDGCEVVMSDTLEFRKHSLAVVPKQAVMNIHAGDSVRLDITITGARGIPQTEWNNEGWLADSAGTEDPMTRPLMTSQVFKVKVTDDFCRVEAEINVNCIGGDLAVEIREEDCTLPVDSLRICAGDAVELCALASGGGGNYSYRWITSAGVSVGDSSRYLTDWIPSGSGYVYVEVSSYNERVKDSVWVGVEERLQTDTLEAAGLRCILPDDSVTIVLKGSTRAAVYMLQYSSDGTVYMDMDTLSGTGSPLVFTLTGLSVAEGYYRIRAGKITAGIREGCEYLMAGRVEIRRGLQRFGLSGGGEFCSGDTALRLLRLDGSERGVNYVLYAEPARREMMLAGTGDILEYRYAFSSGKYYVEGERENCRDTMNGRVEVKVHASPSPGVLSGAGVHCIADTPVVMQIPNGEAGTEYVVKKINPDGVSNSRVFYGTGILNLGRYTEIADYIVTARDTLSGCEVKVDSMCIREIPDDIEVGVEGMVCSEATEVRARVWVVPAVPGVRYTLCRVPEIPLAILTETSGDTSLYTGNLAAGMYTIRATAGSCERQYADTIRIGKGAEIPMPELPGPDSLCEGMGEIHPVVYTQTGYTYSLFLPDGTRLDREGDDGAFDFGTYTAAGDYALVVRDNTNGCERRNDTAFRIERLSRDYMLSGGGVFCNSVETGKRLNLSGSDSLVTYILEKKEGEGWKEMEAVTGDGKLIVFSQKYPAGTYRVVAGRICRKEMINKAEVVPLRYLYGNLQREGVACTDSTVVLSVSPAHTGYDFTLYKDGEKVAGQTQSGDDGRLAWILSPAVRGVYQVKTEITGCLVTVDDSVRIGDSPELGILQGDSVVCENTKGLLYMEHAQADVEYGLYVWGTDTLYCRGVINEGMVEYRQVEAGRYYVKAAMGDCEVVGDSTGIRKIEVTTDSVWEVLHCAARDEGRILIRGMEAGNTYRVRGETVFIELAGHNGDTLLTGLPWGEYDLEVEDGTYGCRVGKKETVREGVYTDSLLHPFSYCATEEGLQLRLSGTRLGVTYSILDTAGVELMAVSRPQTLFPQRLPEGRYVFRKWRNEPDGCEEREEFRIVRDSLPDTGVAVELKGSYPVCAGHEYTVELKGSESGVSYYLYHVDRALYLDTLTGSGAGDEVFTKTVKEGGKYRIYAGSAAGGCRVRLDTVPEISFRPLVPRIDTCRYCYDAGGAEEGCAVVLKGMESTVTYYLEGISVRDTLLGPGTGMFKKHPAGGYDLIVADTSTGCTDTVRIHIGSALNPEVYAVEGYCDTVEAVNTVKLSGSGKDSVVYRLYRNGISTGKILVGNGSALEFTDISDAGVYRVKARKVDGDCEVWMEDSVVLYYPLKVCGDTLNVEGSFCENVSEGGVRLSYPCSVEGWKYYVTNGVYNSEELEGGGRLAWTRIAGGYIREGEYELYARNACGLVRLVAGAEVKALPAPAEVELENDSLDYCAGGSFEIVLKTSETGVLYQVKCYTLNYDLVEAGEWQEGTGNRLSLGEYSAAGYYEIKGRRITGGCEKLMGSMTVPVGKLPDLQQITGSDVCIAPGGTGSIVVGIPVRESGVAYYLYRDEYYLVDSLTSGYRPGYTDFSAQTVNGCYSVVARFEPLGCERKMDGYYCMNTAPAVYNMMVTEDTLDLCVGTEICLEIDNNETGVHYVLVHDGVEESAGVVGNTGGGVLEVGCADEEGYYRVKAVVGDCWEWMNDSVYLQMQDLPVLEAVAEYHFCAGSAGVQIEVKAPTNAAYEYSLQDADGNLIEVRPGEASGEGFEFRAVSQPGLYQVIVEDSICGNVQEVNLVRDPVPAPLRLISLSGNYICDGGSVQLGVEGKLQEDVTYELHKVGDSGMYTWLQNNSIFRKPVTSPGTYYVTAVVDTGLFCSVDFGSLTIEMADTLETFEVVRKKNVYCETDLSEGTIGLSGSETGVSYELYRDNQPTGLTREGTGGPLEWTGVPGKPCSGSFSSWDGYVYRVVAKDTLTGCIRNMYGSDTIVVATWSSIVGTEMKDLDVCQGERAYLSVTATGCATVYTWYQDGVVVKSGRESFYNIDSLLPIDAGTYYCEVDNVCNMPRQSPRVTIDVRRTAYVVSPMEDVRLCDETVRDVKLSSAFGGNIKSYSWYKTDASSSVLSTKSYLDLIHVTESEAGKYVCRVESGNNCGFASDTVEVFVGDAPRFVFTERTDTLCKGSDYFAPEVSVVNADSVCWFLNGHSLACRDTVYKVRGIGLSDEGVYSVVAYSNKCGDVGQKIATLWVDDSLRVVATDSLIVGCEGSTKYLALELSSMERVSWRWEKEGVTVGTDSRLLAGPFTSDSVQTYRVWFRNKCTSAVLPSYRDVVVQVPRPIRFDTASVREILLCAGEVADTALQVNVNPESLAELRWYYHAYGDTTNVAELGSDTTTIRVPVTTGNTGYYYAVAYNACQRRVASPDVWLRVDSIPVPLSVLENDTVCPDGVIRLSLSSSGGNQTYRWYVERRDGRLDSTEIYRLNYWSSSELCIQPADVSYDSCRIWCKLQNSCGEAITDTVLIRVNKQLQLAFETDTVHFCSGSRTAAIVELKNGTLPWSYRYRTPSGREYDVRGLESSQDTLWVAETGVYQLVYVADTLDCMLTEAQGLPGVYAVGNDRAILDFSGGGYFCQGDTAFVRLQVSGGVGPWEVTITDGLNPALAVCAGYPIVMYGRDTVLYFTALDSAVYHINRTVYDRGSGCWGEPTDSIVRVDVHYQEHITFVPGPWHVGQCNPVNLYGYLRPSVNGMPVTQGRFYINDEVLGSDHVWPQHELRGDSCYQVVYRYTDTAGCLSSSDLIRVCVDSLPHSEIFTSFVSCESVASDFSIQLYPAGYIDTAVIRMTRYKKQSPGGIPSYVTQSYGPADIPASGLLNIPLRWDQVISPDSCLVFELLLLRDRYGCEMSYSIPEYHYRDTVWRKWLPEVEVKTRLLSESSWTVGRTELNILQGDSVAVWVSLTKGSPVWSLPFLGIDSIVGTDTLLWLKEEGTYSLRPKDNVCGLLGMRWPEVKVTYLDTGYFCGRLWLEGPFDQANGLMHLGSCSGGIQIRDSLKLPQSLPLKPAGLEVIDWIMVELRVGTSVDSVALLTDSAFSVSRDSCLLLSNGMLADRYTGDTLVGIPKAYGSGLSYRYVVVKHRNHLGVMSAYPIQLVRKGERNISRFIDFTKAENIYTRDKTLSNHMTYYTGIGWLLSAGEVNKNKLISLFDPNRITIKDIDPMSSGMRCYDLIYDVNLDGCIDWPGWNSSGSTADWDIVKRNRRKFMEIK